MSCDQIFGLLPRDTDHSFPYPHVTFVQDFADLKFEECTDETCNCVTKQHCPMCNVKTQGKLKTGTLSFKQLKRHMTQFHWNKAVKHEGTIGTTFFKENKFIFFPRM